MRAPGSPQASGSPRGRSEAECRTPEGPGRSDFGVTFSAGVSPRAPKAGLSLPAACGRALEPAPNPARRSLPAPRPAPQRRAPLGLPSARRHLLLRDEPPLDKCGARMRTQVRGRPRTPGVCFHGAGRLCSFRAGGSNLPARTGLADRGQPTGTVLGAAWSEPLPQFARVRGESQAPCQRSRVPWLGTRMPRRD